MSEHTEEFKRACIRWYKKCPDKIKAWSEQNENILLKEMATENLKIVAQYQQKTT